MDRQPFGRTPAGERVELFTLSDRIAVSVMTYGAAVQRLILPDGTDVALGFSTLPEYIENPGHYFGATVGRYANRIAGGRFAVDGAIYELDRNNGDNCLHGGARGFDTRVWKVVDAADTAIRLAYSSPHGEMGFPGDLDVAVEYRVTGFDLRIDYDATTSAPTVVNLTNHTCWNLAGEGGGPVDTHVLMLAASAYTPVGPDLVPAGEVTLVEGTPLDFRAPMPIGTRGFDHNLVLDSSDGSLALAARVVDPRSGHTLEVLTTEPGLQLYTGTFLDGSLIGKSGRAYGCGDCVALETQHFPDSPNKPAFPSTVLRPGERLASTTVYRFA